MRIEGTYTFPGTIEQVFAALIDPEVLRRALDGCERLIQLGPTETVATFEVRLRPNAQRAPVTLMVAATLRRPMHLRLDVRGHGPAGAFTGRGVVDLVANEAHTIGAYRVEVDTPEAARDAVAVQVRALCAGLARELVAARQAAVPRLAPTPRAAPVRLAQTRLGDIVALPAAAPGGSLVQRATPWAQRALWLATGMVLGMAAFSVTLAVSRWLGFGSGRRGE